MTARLIYPVMGFTKIRLIVKNIINGSLNLLTQT